MNTNSLQLYIDRAILFLLALCIGVMPLIYFPYDKFSLVQYRIDVIFKPKQNFLIIIELILLILFVIHLKVNKKSIKLNKIFFLLGTFYTLLVLSTLFSDYKKIALFGRPFRLEGLIAYTTYLLLFLMIYVFVDNHKKTKTLIYSLLSSAIIISIYGIMQYYNIDPIYKDPYLITGIYQNRAFSTLGNPVFAGSYASMLFSIVFILFVFSKAKKIFSYGILTILFYAFLLSTASKAGIIGTIISLIVFLFIFKKKIIDKKKFLYLFIILMLITFLMEVTGKPVSPLKRFSDFFSTMIKTKNSIELRYNKPKIKNKIIHRQDFPRPYIYKTGIKLLLKNPILGSGLDTFDKVFPQKKENRLLDKAHNEYIQLAITVGIPALIIYLLFLFYIIKFNFNNFTKINPYQIALFFGILAYWIQAIFNISVVSVAPVYWGLMGLNLAIAKIEGLKD